MASKKRKYRQKFDFDADDDMDFMYDDDIELKSIARDFYSVDFEQDYDDSSQITARRQIERKRDMQKLYSQLDEWEEYAGREEWY